MSKTQPAVKVFPPPNDDGGGDGVEVGLVRLVGVLLQN